MDRTASPLGQGAGREWLRVDVRGFPESTRTAQEAASAIGCEVGQIVKSLVFDASGSPVMS
jgi:prolyl-tRNA editing enzyme YbaK/EbsC (Cys-tRNA(Pro) deacylase)